jgi:hydroxyacylglutathione hydrolase
MHLADIGGVMNGTLPARWNHGSANCGTNTDPALQVHAFREDTYILRQNKCHNYEAPFLYLLLGKAKALLVDTGADPGPGRELPVRAVVQAIIERYEEGQHLNAIELVVAPSHAHGDHAHGDEQFTGQPRTTVVSGLRGVREFFGFARWPNQQVSFDLGERRLTVLAIPGHEPTHLAFYDPRTRILLSGDTVYPGYVYVSDWSAYRRSIKRLVRFASDHPIRYILGAHVEMSSRPGVAYPAGATYQPDEHVLQLSPQHLHALHAALTRLGNTPTRTVLDDFIIQPV